MSERLLYGLVCIFTMIAIFNLQAWRHRASGRIVRWSYTALAFALGWEVLDCLIYSGVPGFPASRWVLVPALGVILSAAAFKDWNKRKLAEKA
jgi:hypothetical protein